MPRIIFAGTPDFAAVHLNALLDAGIRPVAVYSQPDRPAGRGHKLTPSAVKALALSHDLKVYTPENFRSEDECELFEAHQADLAIVVAYGLLLPQRVLDAPRLGCINVHGSLLPRYRGAAPIQRALLNGEDKTGISIMRLVKAMDAGPVFTTAILPISSTDTSGSLFEKLSHLGARTLLETLPSILDGSLSPVAQDESRVSYAAKITKDEAGLDFTLPAAALELKVRGLNPWPAAVCRLNGTVYKIFAASVIKSGAHDSPGTILAVNRQGIEVACSTDSLMLEIMQAPGKGRSRAADYARSRADLFAPGKCFDH